MSPNRDSKGMKKLQSSLENPDSLSARLLVYLAGTILCVLQEDALEGPSRNYKVDESRADTGILYGGSAFRGQTMSDDH